MVRLRTVSAFVSAALLAAPPDGAAGSSGAGAGAYDGGGRSAAVPQSPPPPVPAKGFFTQGAAVLLKRPVSLDDVAGVLYGLEPTRSQGVPGDADGPTRHPADAYGSRLVVPFPASVPGAARGTAAVDVAPIPWPDDMGDPEDAAGGGMALFAAWSFGQFGPGAFPDNLAAAVAQSWHWDGAEAAVAKHAAFARVLTTYAVGSEPDDPVLPGDYDPAAELGFVTEICDRLLNLPGALCYFNPAGCCVWPAELYRKTRAYHADEGTAPHPLWANVRLMKFDEDWSVMDTTGNLQLDLPDVEFVLKADRWDLHDADAQLRNLSLYLLDRGESPAGGRVIATGNTVDGPAPAGAVPGGGRDRTSDVPWRATVCEDGVAAPPRRTLRLVAQDGTEPPAELLRVRHPNRSG